LYISAEEMKRYTTPSSSDSLASIAADWEDSMLHSCLSTDFDDSKSWGRRGRHADVDAREESDDDDEYESFADRRRRIQADLSSDSTISIDSSDSDISLCRASSSIKPDRTPQASAPSSICQDDNSEADGECYTISVVSSLANLFLGKDGPCSLHLEDDDSHLKYYPTHSALAGNRGNTQPMLKKSSMKKMPAIGTTTTTTAATAPGTALISANFNKNRQNVSFADVKLREYTLSLGQNPSCSEGPPIELGWEFREQTPVPLEHYEEIKARQPRRRLQELILSNRARRLMLLEKYTQEELTEAIRLVEQLKRQRVMTCLMLPASALDEAAEEVYRYMTNVFK
jgi:hypothetical protein